MMEPRRKLLGASCVSIFLIQLLVALSASASPHSLSNKNHNYALRFDGAGDYCEIPPAQSLNITGQISMEAWILWDGLTGHGGGQIILNQDFIVYEIAVGETYNPGRFSWFLDKVSTSAPDAGSGWYDGGPVTIGQWNHVAVSYDGKMVRTFINGEKIHEFTGSGRMPIRSNHVRIGARGDHDPPGSFFNGLIDEVRLWSVGRNETDFRSFMNTPLEGNEPGLVGYWDFNEGSGQTAHDLSPFRNNARLGSILGEDSGDPIWVLTDRPMGNLELSAHLEPQAPTTSDDLICIASATSEGSVVDPAFSYRWFRNGAEILEGMTVGDEFSSATGPSLSHHFTGKGESYFCIVKAASGSFSKEVETEPVTIVNSPPSAPVIRILPENPSPEDGLAVWIDTPSVDPDGDVVLYLFEWYESQDGSNWTRRPEVSGNLRPFYPGSSEISSLYTQAAEFWRVVVTPIEADTLAKRAGLQGKEANIVVGDAGVSQVFIVPDLVEDQVIDPKDLLLLKAAWGSNLDELDPGIRVLFYENGEVPVDGGRLFRILAIIQQGWYRSADFGAR
jgi:hypothetical protein